MIREIIQLGNPILRNIAALVEEAANSEVSAFVQDMQETLVASNGVGLAAPQIACSERIFIVSSKQNPPYPDATQTSPLLIVNPTIEWQSPEIVEGWEGCLSIPGIRGIVPRSSKIRISYWNLEESNRVTTELSDFTARIFLHEYDHLEGIVYLDRLASNRDIITDLEYKKLISSQSIIQPT